MCLLSVSLRPSSRIAEMYSESKYLLQDDSGCTIVSTCRCLMNPKELTMDYYGIDPNACTPGAYLDASSPSYGASYHIQETYRHQQEELDEIERALCERERD